VRKPFQRAWCCLVDVFVPFLKKRESICIFSTFPERVFIFFCPRVHDAKAGASATTLTFEPLMSLQVNQADFKKAKEKVMYKKKEGVPEGLYM
jgi:hypothetical protein